MAMNPSGPNEKTPAQQAQPQTKPLIIALNAKRDFGATGDGSTDDFTALNDAFIAASSASVTLYIPEGTYITSATLNLSANSKVILDPNATIKPNGNFHTIQIGAYARWEGGTIDVSGVSGFSSAGMFVYPNKLQSGTTYSLYSSVRDLTIVAASSGQAADGLLLDAPQSSTSDSANAIEYCEFDNIQLVNCSNGIHLRSIAVTGNSGAGWVNACNFHGFKFVNCINSIYFNSTQSSLAQVQGHNFTNFQIQPQSLSKHAIFCNGKYNRFEGVIWDLGYVPTGTPLIYFDELASYNRCVTTVKPEDPYWVDNGANNEIIGYGSNILGTLHKIHFPNTLGATNPPGDYNRTGYVGDQDDVFAFANLRFNGISNVNGTAIASGLLANMFDLNGGKCCSFAGMTSNTPLEIVIDCSTTPIDNVQFVGLSFYGSDNYAKQIKVEFDNSNGTYQTVQSFTANNLNEVLFYLWGTPLFRIRLSMYDTPSGNIIISRIFGVSATHGGSAFLTPSSASVTLAQTISQPIANSPTNLFLVPVTGISPQIYEVSATISNRSSVVTAGTVSVTYTDESGILRTVYLETLSGSALNGYKLSQGTYPAVPLTFVAKQGTAITMRATASVSGNLYTSAVLKRL
jgi:hypothetical protein